MIVFAAVTVALLVAVLAFSLSQLYRLAQAAQVERERIAQHRAEEHAQWAEERLALISRIQRPDLLATPADTGFVDPEPEVDESHLVGSIHIDPDFGLDAD